MDVLNSIEARLKNLEDSLLHSKTVLKFDEAAAYCGLSRSYFYKLTSAGVVPHYKPTGKCLFFAKRELDDWLLNNQAVSVETIETKAANYILRGKFSSSKTKGRNNGR